METRDTAGSGCSPQQGRDVAEKVASALACRDPYWKELGLEAKVERLRQVLRRMEEEQEFIARNAMEARELSAAHQHGPQGEVLRPAHSSMANAIGFARDGFSTGPRRRNSQLD